MLKTRSELGRSEVHDRPAVSLWIGPGVPENALRAVLEGMEEQSIPAKVEGAAGLDAVASAHQAAGTSRLDVGVAVLNQPLRAVLHHRELPQKEPLAVLDQDSVNKEDLRLLGGNAARLVKGDPLLEQAPDYSYSSEDEAPVCFRQETMRQDAVAFLVKRVLELLAAQLK